jgi:hypothetical protein
MKKKNPLRKYNLSSSMKQVLFHAESGDEGYATKYNHDLPADRYLSYQHPAVVRALRARKLVKATRNPDFPWVLTKEGRKVGRLLVVMITKQQMLL